MIPTGINHKVQQSTALFLGLRPAKTGDQEHGSKQDERLGYAL